MANHQEAAQTAKIVNGVNVSALFETINAAKATPTIAKFRFRLKNEWSGGSRNRSVVEDFDGGGEQTPHAQPFELEADEPALLLGSDLAPNPVEYLLAALASCVTTSMVYHAAARGIVIEEIESQVEGNIDLMGFLGLDKNVRKGFQAIRMSFAIKADATDEQFEELRQLGPTFSPVFDSLSKGVPVTVDAKRIS